MERKNEKKLKCTYYVFRRKFDFCTEPIAVGGGEGSNEERHSESIRDLGEGDKDIARTHGSAPHQPRGHARLHGQPCSCLRRYGGKQCVYFLFTFSFS